MVIGRRLDVECGDECKVILEFLVAFLESFLYLNRHRVAHDVELVLGDIVNDCTVYSVVDHVAGELLAETTLELAERYMTLAETGDDVGAANLFELLGHIVLIVVLCDGYRETKLYGRDLFL